MFLLLALLVLYGVNTLQSVSSRDPIRRCIDRQDKGDVTPYAGISACIDAGRAGVLDSEGYFQSAPDESSP